MIRKNDGGAAIPQILRFRLKILSIRKLPFSIRKIAFLGYPMFERCVEFQKQSIFILLEFRYLPVYFEIRFMRNVRGS